MSICRACGEDRPADAFRPRNQRTCRSCETKLARAYRQTEAYRELKRRYVMSEKGRATTRRREERQEVRDYRRRFALSPRGRANQKRYASTEKGKATHKEAVAKYLQGERARMVVRESNRRRQQTETRRIWRRRYYQIYKVTEKAKVHRANKNLKRRLRMAEVEGRLTSAEWLQILQNNKNRCFYCKEPKPLTMDHVIPLSKGGRHDKVNVVPACRNCNSRKHTKMWRLC